MIRRRTNIWNDLMRMHDELDALFEGFFGYDPFFNDNLNHRNNLLTDRTNERALTNYRQAISDITETDKEIIATVELPGVEKEDIDINATDTGIEIKVEKKEENRDEDKKKGIYKLERNYVGFYKFIPIPEGAEIDNIKATYKNGVLELRIPKKEEEKKNGMRIKVE